MKRKLLLTLLAGFSFTACSNNILPPAKVHQHIKSVNYENAPIEKIEAFEIQKRKVGLSTQNNPKYNSPIAKIKAKNKKDWFNNQMYKLWDRQITRNQFIADGVSEFPTHRYEFTFIASGF